MDVPLGHEDLQLRPLPTQDTSPSIECHDLCDNGRGNITWYKDSQLLPGESGEILRVLEAMKSAEGVYTCVCTWQHGTHTFNTSASTRLELENASTRLRPTIIHPTNRSTVTCQLGSRVLLECSGSCGISVTRFCNVSWEIHTHSGHTQSYSWEDIGTMRVFKAVLIISEVSLLDLQTQFECTAENRVEWISVTITLKQQESFHSEVLVCVGVLLVLLLVAMAVKWFAIDLALLFRSARRTEDGKVYDAYVVYPRECVWGHAVRECVCEDAARECVCEDALSVFLSSSLPAVLEDQCGYKLFIHGRDDTPGEDQAEQVERCMRLSRRLLVVMTTVGSGGGQVVAPPLEQFDWQMGLHSSLVQEDMSVIMVQVGQGHTQLPPGLQLLLKKSAPLRWEMGVRGANCSTSRFWKRVRYMMPPPPPPP
ncbi:interleukin-1 receptor-like 2 [Sardina pilchardus]|uniref:interleukin-1 receptor-like 2 n=1 Tax=Sardina pilchardus TaxID=27697 RepID=UPI002E13BD3E